MAGAEKNIIVVKELKDYILPPGKEELMQLEKNILQEGCREPLIVWQKSNRELILVDGHNRYHICQKHDIPFRVKKVEFSDVDEVKLWMVENQMGRRNLTPDQMSYYRGLRYLSLKKKKGGYDNVISKGQNETSTSQLIASQFNVSESTVKRDAKFAEGLNIVNKSNPKLKLKILRGETQVRKTDIQILASAKQPDKLVIKNEADLHNKAKQLHEDILNEVEAKIKTFEKQRIEKAQQMLAIREPAFLDRDDRLRKIKGMIISSINRAINEKDSDAIKELKKLVDRLANEILT